MRGTQQLTEAVELDLAADARAGLTAQPKRLPPRLFYDAAGSALFEQITAQPEYYVTRAELEIFERHAAEILEAAGPELTVVELGAGSGAKTQVLLRALLARQGRARYLPVDVSPAALEHCAGELSAAFPKLHIAPLCGRYRVALQGLREQPGRKLVLFIGSSIGNFEPAEAAALLGDVREALDPGDALLLGVDLQKPVERLLAAYDDAAGVTARFNLNVLKRLNRELGADFDPARFRHRALWNPAACRMEMHLESTADQLVRLPALGLTVRFAAGERIHTESCHKFTLKSATRLLEGGGFRAERHWTDGEGLFADLLAR